jgi:hypothetical protein
MWSCRRWKNIDFWCAKCDESSINATMMNAVLHVSRIDQILENRAPKQLDGHDVNLQDGLLE